MNEVTIEVHPRAETGKNANRRLRLEGRIPAVVYGDKKESVPIHVGHKEIETLLRSEGGENAVFLLKMQGTDKSRHAMIRDLQVDPIRGNPIHIDFLRIRMSQKVQVAVPIELEGVPSGVKNQGGVLDFVSREVEVECLPGNIPPHIALDVSALEIGDHVEAGALELPDDVELLDEESKVIVSIAAARVVEEEEKEEEEELLEAPTAEPERIGEDAEDEG